VWQFPSSSVHGRLVDFSDTAAGNGVWVLRVSSSIFIAALLSGLAGYGVLDYELARPFQFLSLALTLIFPFTLGTDMLRQLKRPDRTPAEADYEAEVAARTAAKPAIASSTTSG
jgi:hypothetical protein